MVKLLFWGGIRKNEGRAKISKRKIETGSKIFKSNIGARKVAQKFSKIIVVHQKF